MPSDTRSARICRCQHPYAAHQHYRAGAACSLCDHCARYRSALGLLARLRAYLPGRSGPLR